jgi:hypothetical protein
MPFSKTYNLGVKRTELLVELLPARQLTGLPTGRNPALAGHKALDRVLAEGQPNKK